MQHLKDYISESILSSTGAGKQHIYKKWLEENTNAGTQIKYNEKTGVYDLFGLSKIIAYENFPAGIKIGYCTTVDMTNITTLKGFPEFCNYITIHNADLDNFEGCPADPNKIVISSSNIKSLDGLPKYVDHMSIGGNKQHFHAKDINRVCKCKNITTLGVFFSDGTAYFSEEEKEYIKGVAKELEKMLKNDIKELQRVDCVIDKMHRVFLLLVFEDNAGFEGWPNSKSVSGNPDYHNNNIYTSFVYLPEERTLARFKQGALDTPYDFVETQKTVHGNVKTQVKTLDYPYLANGGKDFGAVKIDFFAKDICDKIKKYVKNVVDAAKEDGDGTLHRTTETKFMH